MKQEINQIAELFSQLKMKYEMSQCTNCLAMRDYLTIEFQRLMTNLNSLETLCFSNQIEKKALEEVQRMSSLLGLYLMV